MERQRLEWQCQFQQQQREQQQQPSALCPLVVLSPSIRSATAWLEI